MMTRRTMLKNLAAAMSAVVMTAAAKNSTNASEARPQTQPAPANTKAMAHVA